MTNAFLFLNSLFLTIIIFLQTPPETVGLTEFGATTSSQKFLNALIAISTLTYLIFAIELNL